MGGGKHSVRDLYIRNMMNSSNFKLFFLVSVWRVHVLLCSFSQRPPRVQYMMAGRGFLIAMRHPCSFSSLTLDRNGVVYNRAKWENAVLAIPWNKKTKTIRRYYTLTCIHMRTSKWWFAEKLFMCIKFYYFSSTIHKRIYYYAFHKVSTSSELSDNNENAKQL